MKKNTSVKRDARETNKRERKGERIFGIRAKGMKRREISCEKNLVGKMENEKKKN